MSGSYHKDDGGGVLLAARVPQGLAAAVEGLTREVIRHQPDNIYAFAALHFERLLELREQQREAAPEPPPKRRQNSRDDRPRGSWGSNSLGDAAEALQKHRGIFGESERQRVSADELRELLRRNSSAPSPPGVHHHHHHHRHRQERSRCSSRDRQHSCEGERFVPQSNSQERHRSSGSPGMPLSKQHIKSELRRNRIRSSERRVHVSREYHHHHDQRMRTSSTTTCTTTTTTTTTTEKLLEQRSSSSLRRRSRASAGSQRSSSVGSGNRDGHDDESRLGRDGQARSEPEQQQKHRQRQRDKSKSSPGRGSKMDGVRSYVVQNLVNMTSLDELQSPSYVARVQRVIDETASLIKQKVDALKSDAALATAASRTTSYDGDLVARSEVDQEEFVRVTPSSNQDQESKTTTPRLPEVTRRASSTSLPSRTSSSSSSSRRSARGASATGASTAQEEPDLVLPPITPESARSTREVPEEPFRLPPVQQTTLTPPREEQAPERREVVESDKLVPRSAMNLLQREEEFPDSLNVTPEPARPKAPDSLEPSDAEEEVEEVEEQVELAEKVPKEKVCEHKVKDDELVEMDRLSDALKDRLQEVEQAQKRILESTPTTGCNLERRLSQIERTERRIEHILDSSSLQTRTIAATELPNKIDSNTTTSNDDIGSRLKELHEAELRLERVFERSEAVSSQREDYFGVVSYVLSEGSPQDIPDAPTLANHPEDDRSAPQDLIFGEKVVVEDRGMDSEDERVLRVVTSSLEEILEKDELLAAAEDKKEPMEVSPKDESTLTMTSRGPGGCGGVETTTNKDTATESSCNFLEEEEEELATRSIPVDDDKSAQDGTRGTSSSSGEAKETSAATTTSPQLSLDPQMPHVPELNLDSLPDVTVSSFVLSDDEAPLLTLSAGQRVEAEGHRDEVVKIGDAPVEVEVEVREAREPTEGVVELLQDVGASRDEEVEVDAEPKLKSARQEAIVTNEQVRIGEEVVRTEQLESRVAEPGESEDREGDTVKEKLEPRTKSMDSARSESSSFLSAATTIQAGIRGFLARRRLHRSSNASQQRNSSTLDSVSSIQESFVVESTTTVGTAVETITTQQHAYTTTQQFSKIDESQSHHIHDEDHNRGSESGKPGKLRREDAVQCKTLSLEGAFGEERLQHTGEFHDCIPLPVFASGSLHLPHHPQQPTSPIPPPEGFKNLPSGPQATGSVLSNLLLNNAASSASSAGKLGPFVDVVLLPADAMLRSGYLNFITSVEDVVGDNFVPGSPKGVVIEEITSSIEEPLAKSSEATADDEGVIEETSASLSACDVDDEEPLASMNIDEVLGFGAEDDERPRLRLDLLGSSSDSQKMTEARSPLTVMQMDEQKLEESAGTVKSHEEIGTDANPK